MATQVDDRTPHLNLPLPFIDNPMSFDLPRLRAAFGALDGKAQSDDDLHTLFSEELHALGQRLDALEAVTLKEETQALTEGQTVVNLTVLTSTKGATVYIEGVRLKASDWVPHATIATRLTLNTTYPAGHEVTVTRQQGGV